MATFKPVMPHGDIETIFPDTFFVTGTTRPEYMGQTWQFSRNMTIVRDGSALTLINSVRLDDAGLARLDELGKVAHIVKLGAFHGMDDAFYCDRYGAKQWALSGMQHEADHGTDQELAPGGPTPFSGCSVFVYETSDTPEGLLLIDREGGILVSCDSIQNWAEVDRFFNDDSAQKMTSFGFIKAANVGPGWRQSANPEASDFARIKSLPFRHLLPAHGTPLRDKAKEALSATFAELFDV